MRDIRGIGLVVLLYLILAPFSEAQSDHDNRPDRWRGLILGESTPNDTVDSLGPPSSDKVTSLSVTLVDKWLGTKHKQKIFRTLSFEKVKGFDEAKISFLDNKLVMIRLTAKSYDDPDWIDPDNLQKLFGSEFTPLVKFMGKRMPALRDYDANRERASKKEMDGMYDMLAVTERSFIVTRVDNGAFGRNDLVPGSRRRRDKELKEMSAGGEYPGEVVFIQLISRGIVTPE